MKRLDGCIALVTGAGRGIGAAIALRYAQEGASVIVADIHEKNVREVAGQVSECGVQTESLIVDVADPQSSQSMISEIVERFGRIDVLVNNAGVIRVRPLLDTTKEDWDFVQSVNARGLFFTMQAGARQMLGQAPLGEGRPCGKIINMASIAGRGGRRNLGAYSASKSTVISVTQTAAIEFAPKLTVNSICPGPVDTEMWKQIDREWTALEERPLGSAWKERTDAVPMGRGETPADVTGMALFLASADADYITGQSYHVDGGVVML